MVARNYHQIIQSLNDIQVNPLVIGYSIFGSVIDNFLNNMEIYFLDYPKEFRNKENNRVFRGLEKLLSSNEFSQEEVEQELLVKYDQTAIQTSKHIVTINFAYDAINFSMIQNQRDIPETANFLGENLLVLARSSFLKQHIASIKDESARTAEYNMLIDRYKRDLQKTHGIIFQ